LHHFEIPWAGLFDDGERTITIRCEGFHGGRIKNCTIAALADRKGRDNFAVVGVENDAGLGLVAHGEENAVLGVKAQARGPAAFAGQILKNEWVRPNKRIFNNAKVSDHFAIIPTSLAPKSLSEPEQKLYDLVTRRFLAVFYPAAEFLETTRITRVESEPFKTEGKVMTNAGWLAIYGKEAQTDDTPTLAPVQPNETVQTTNVEVIAAQTKPPARFNEATLLSAMEGAGKLVDDEELREAMREKGLGTPATRASIIEGLIYEKYVLRQGRDLQPTAKAFSLITLLRGLQIPELSSPELTGDWEFKLRRMARGEMQRPEFMKEIADMTRAIVGKAKRHESDTVPGDFGTLQTPCPKCGGEIHEQYRQYQCTKEGCDFAMWKTLCSRMFEPEEIEKLVSDRLKGLRADWDKQFTAVTAERDSLNTRLTSIQIDQGIITVATKRGLRPTDIPDITARARTVFKLVNGAPQAFESDGKTVRYGKDGFTPMTLEEWADAQVTDAPHLFESNAGGGAASTGAGGAAGSQRSVKNPYRKDTWNLTEQMKLQKSDPGLAARLKAAA